MGKYLKMESISADSLRAGITYTSDLMVDSSFLFLPKTAEMTDDLIKALKQWGFDNLISDGSVSLGGDIGVSKADEEAENETDPHIYNHGLVTVGEKSNLPDGITVGKNSVIAGDITAGDLDNMCLGSGKTLIKAGDE